MRKCKNCLKEKEIEEGEVYCPVCNFSFDSKLKDKVKEIEYLEGIYEKFDKPKVIVKQIERSVFNLTNNILKMYYKRKIESNK